MIINIRTEISIFLNECIFSISFSFIYKVVLYPEVGLAFVTLTVRRMNDMFKTVVLL